MHAECSRRQPTCTEEGRSGLPASRLQLQRSSSGSMYPQPPSAALYMHDSARMTQPAHEEYDLDPTARRCIAPSDADTGNKKCPPVRASARALGETCGFREFPFFSTSSRFMATRSPSGVCLPCCNRHDIDICGLVWKFLFWIAGASHRHE